MNFTSFFFFFFFFSSLYNKKVYTDVYNIVIISILLAYNGIHAFSQSVSQSVSQSASVALITVEIQCLER